MSSEYSETNFAKLNVIQYEIVDLFQKNNLTRPEVFAILKGMRHFKMVNRELAEKWWDELKWADPFEGMTDQPFVPDRKEVNDGFRIQTNARKYCIK